jgi:hypothetical protein
VRVFSAIRLIVSFLVSGIISNALWIVIIELIGLLLSLVQEFRIIYSEFVNMLQQRYTPNILFECDAEFATLSLV